MSPISFNIEKKIKNRLGRAGLLKTKNGIIGTPAFVVVGTKATVKSLSPEQVSSLGAQVVLANTYHLYLQPGEKLIKESGGLSKFMNWHGPTMTDSGGFQVFSLGDAFGSSVTKVSKTPILKKDDAESVRQGKLAKIDEEGVTFTSHLDGSSHRFTPERSIEIQNNIGANMIFAFDECTSPHASYEYQKEAMARTHRWAKRCVDFHRISGHSNHQALFGIVQGGRFEDLRKESSRIISAMEFDGFGIGGSFDKVDMYSTLAWVSSILPEEKPRHLLGIGEPEDIFGAVENGSDLFDCVAPTRIARNGTLYTPFGKINIMNSKFRSDMEVIDSACNCYTCQNYSKAYLAHLFRAKEMFASSLASIHNLYFLVNLVKKIRQSILDDNFHNFKEDFLAKYYQQK